MILAAFTQIGQYEVLAPLGSGGLASARGVTGRELWRGLGVAVEARM
jgi:hypothetical protein